MSKTINLLYKEKEYILEYTRKSVETLERQGIVAEDLIRKPMTILPALFRGAFIANHPTMKHGVADEIFDEIPNKQDLIGKLVEMYNEPISVLFEDSEEDSGNIEWGANF